MDAGVEAGKRAVAKVLLLQGANMTRLGRREPELYGTTTAAELDAMMTDLAAARGVELDICYVDGEGAAIARLFQAADDGVDGLLMNPAGFTYAGYALRDGVRAAALPTVEIHMTNLERRAMRSATAAAADGVIYGFGVHSYVLGLDALLGVIAQRAGQTA